MCVGYVCMYVCMYVYRDNAFASQLQVSMENINFKFVAFKHVRTTLGQVIAAFAEGACDSFTW